MHVLNLRGPLPGCLQDGVGGSQPLIALFEGANSMLGACMVDVPLSTISLSQWQVGGSPVTRG
jgi:hypothetical protein